MIDLGGRTVDSRCIFMVVAGANANGDAHGSVLHKVAVTLPVLGDYERHIAELPLQEFTIGGEVCEVCQEQRQTLDGRASQTDRPECTRLHSADVSSRLSAVSKDKRLCFGVGIISLKSCRCPGTVGDNQISYPSRKEIARMTSKNKRSTSSELRFFE